MKAGVLAAAAALAVGVSAAGHHQHESFHKRGAFARSINDTLGEYNNQIPAKNGSEECGCYTVWVTSYGEPTVKITPPKPSSTPVEIVTSIVVPVPVPTAEVSTFPEPGTYTIPEQTITVTKETTVCEATTTSVPSGTHTYGGVTTIVETATTIVCPVATVETSEGVVTSIIKETTFVCPTAGTYTIAPSTTVVEESTVFVYPTPASYAPGTYTHPEQVVTVTETNFVYVCPFTSEGIAVPAEPTSAPAPPPPPPPPPAPAPVEPAPVVEAPVVPQQKQKVAPPPAANGPTLGDNTDHWALTYTPYTVDGQCKGAAEVSADLADIKAKGFSTVRLYSADKTDCNGLENVSNGCKEHGLYLIVGVFIKADGIPAAQPQIDNLATFPHWDIVSLVVVGNEALFAGFCSPGELAAFIANAKQVFRGAGYNGPVTTTEPLNILQQHAGTLCDVVDVLGANIHPFFNSDVTAETCGEFAKNQLDIVDSLCPGKQGINLEIGWPSAGRCNGAACPGLEQQATAMAGVRASLGGKSVFFSYHNDEWKEPGEFGCERSWGIGQLF